MGAKRAMMSHYQTYYEERAKALDAIIEKFKQPSTFEEFVANVYSPSQLGTILQGSLRSGNQSCGSVSNSNHSRSDMSAVLLDQGVLEDKRHGWEEGAQVRPRAHTEHELRGSRGEEHAVLTRAVTTVPGEAGQP